MSLIEHAPIAPGRPIVNSFNPKGRRFVVDPKEVGHQTYTVFQWLAPGGYQPIVTCHGMYGVNNALEQANDIAAYYETRQPLRD